MQSKQEATPAPSTASLPAPDAVPIGEDKKLSDYTKIRKELLKLVRILELVFN